MVKRVTVLLQKCLKSLHFWNMSRTLEKTTSHTHTHFRTKLLIGRGMWKWEKSVRPSWTEVTSDSGMETRRISFSFSQKWPQVSESSVIFTKNFRPSIAPACCVSHLIRLAKTSVLSEKLKSFSSSSSSSPFRFHVFIKKLQKIFSHYRKHFGRLWRRKVRTKHRKIEIFSWGFRMLSECSTLLPCCEVSPLSEDEVLFSKAFHWELRAPSSTQCGNWSFKRLRILPFRTFLTINKKIPLFIGEHVVVAECINTPLRCRR